MWLEIVAVQTMNLLIVPENADIGSRPGAVSARTKQALGNIQIFLPEALPLFV